MMKLKYYFTKEDLLRLRELVETFEDDNRKYWKRELKKIRRIQWLKKIQRAVLS